MLDVQVIETSGLGDRSYLAHDGQVGMVVDPQRDIDRVLALAGAAGVRNSTGPEPVDLRPAHRADPAELRRRLDAGEWVVDLRSRKAFAVSHLAGTISLGLDGALATWLGWLTQSQQRVTLLGDSPEQVAAAQRELIRVGIDRPAAAATGSPEQWTQHADQLARLAVADFTELARARAGHASDGFPDVVLDVRTTSEWNSSHLDGAVHIPLYELPRRLPELPVGAIWVHCGSGYRAAAAASSANASPAASPSTRYAKASAGSCWPPAPCSSCSRSGGRSANGRARCPAGWRCR